MRDTNPTHWRKISDSVDIVRNMVLHEFLTQGTTPLRRYWESFLDDASFLALLLVSADIYRAYRRRPYLWKGAFLVIRLPSSGYIDLNAMRITHISASAEYEWCTICRRYTDPREEMWHGEHEEFYPPNARHPRNCGWCGHWLETDEEQAEHDRMCADYWSE